MPFGKQRPRQAQKEFDDTNRGILFENDRKRGDRDPDYKGSINVDGTDYWLSGWEKETKRGPALSLSVQPKDESRRKSYDAAQRPQEPRRRQEDNGGYQDRLKDEPPPVDDYDQFDR